MLPWGKRKRVANRLEEIKREADLTSLRTENNQLREIVNHINELGKKARREQVVQFSKDLYSHGCEVTIIVHPFPAITRRTTHAHQADPIR